MAKIIFERLTIKEQERVIGGDTAPTPGILSGSHNLDYSRKSQPYSADEACRISPTSDSNGCIIKQIFTIDDDACSIGTT